MAAKGITIQIQGDGAGAAEALRLIEERMQQTADRGKSMSEQLAAAGEKIQSAFQMVGIGFGIREAIDGLREMASRSIDLGMEIGHMAQQTGISAQTLSVLRYTAQQTGIDFEVLSKGFKKMSTDIFEWQHGEKLAGEAFVDLGISLKDVQAKGQDMYGILEMIANKFQEMPDGPHKLAIAVELFGRAGQQMIPILNQGATGLEEYRSKAAALGLVLDEQGIKKMEELHKTLADVKGAFEGAALAATEKMAPALEYVANKVAQMMQSSYWQQFRVGLAAMAHDMGDLAAKAALLSQGDFEGAKQIDAQNKAYWQNFAKQQRTGSAAAPSAASAASSRPAASPLYGSAAADPAADPMDASRAAATATANHWIQAWNYEQAEAAKDAAQLFQQAYDQSVSEQQAALLAVFKSPTPNVQLDPNALNREAVQARIAQQMDANQQKQDQGQQNRSYDAERAAGMIGGFMDQLTSQALKGKISFKSLVDSAIMDLERWSMEIMEKQVLLPMLNNLFGVGGSAAAGSQSSPILSADSGTTSYSLPYLASGGDLDSGWAVVGDGGDGSGSELFAPKGPGTVLPHDVLEGIASMKGGGGGAPNVTINNVNNSSSQVKMSQAGASWDSQAKQFVIHTVLEDMEQGGPMSAALSGFAPK